MSQSGWYEAMKRTAVQEALREAQTAFVLEAENLRATAKARAVEVAMDLMMNAKSENVKARMVEFILSDGKGQGTQIAVSVDARHVGAKGYEFARYMPDSEAKPVDNH